MGRFGLENRIHHMLEEFAINTLQRKLEEQGFSILMSNYANRKFGISDLKRLNYIQLKHVCTHINETIVVPVDEQDNQCDTLPPKA